MSAGGPAGVCGRGQGRVIETGWHICYHNKHIIFRAGLMTGVSRLFVGYFVKFFQDLLTQETSAAIMQLQEVIFMRDIDH